MARAADNALHAAFGAAAPAHFDWQTSAAFVSERERDLVRNAFLPLGGRVLDLGCGEGATLYHLGAPEGAVGVDLFEQKLIFARSKLPKCTFVAASACHLPFEPASFDHVLVRDVVHHVEEPHLLADECFRVLAPGGRIDVLEPCRYNPLILLHALSRVEERGELRSTPSFLEELFSRRFRVITIRAYQAFPVHRLVFHPDVGRPALAHHGAVRTIVGAIERAAERVMPRWSFAYIHIRAVVP